MRGGALKKYLLVGAAGVVIAASAWAAWSWHGSSKYKAGYDAAILEQQARSAEIMATVIEETNRRIDNMEKAKNESKKMADRATSDAANARAASVRLRERIDKLVADAKRDYPALADGGPTTGTSVDMLAYMLGRVGEAAEQLAEYADRARIAGLTCERIHDGLSSAP